MNNKDLRKQMSQLRLMHWEVAEKIGISDSRFSVWLRTPLTQERRERVEHAIEELKQSFTGGPTN